MRYNKSIFTVCLILLILSCHEEGEPVGSNIISYVRLFPQDDSWIVFSDQTGKILYTRSAADNTWFYYDELIDTKVTISIVNKLESSDGSEYWYINTYTDVAIGTYESKFNFDAFQPAVGQHIIYNNIKTQLNRFNIYSNERCGYAYPTPGYTQFHISTCKENEKIFLSFKKNESDIPRYLFIDIQSGGQSYIDDAMLDTFSEQSFQVLNFDKVTYVNVLLTGRSPERRMELANDYSQHGTSVKAYYPGTVPENMFDSYQARLDYINADGGFTQVKTSSTIDFSINPLEVQLISVPKRQYPEIAFNTSGSAHYYKAVLDEHGDKRYVNWTIHGKYSNNTSVVLPKLNLALQLPVIAHDLILNELVFVESDVHKSYEGFYKSMLGTYVPDGDMRSRSYRGL